MVQLKKNFLFTRQQVLHNFFFAHSFCWQLHISFAEKKKENLREILLAHVELHN